MEIDNWANTTYSANNGELGIDDDLKCNQYIYNNKTQLLPGNYEGIPVNLLINFLGWLVLLSLFTVLRKNAWNYGRLALVQKTENRPSLHGYSRYNVWTHLFYAREKESRPATEPEPQSYDFNVRLDQGYLSWIPAVFKIKDEHILAKSGRDAVQYLSFQKHIITYAMIVCILCITIILPINFQGTLEGREFGHTTMSNLVPSSPYMWVHVTLAFLFLPLGIVFTRHFSRSLSIRELTVPVSRTLMITRVPRKACRKEVMLKHFSEAYEDIEVQDIQFSYDIHRLVNLDKDRELIQSARLYCEEYLRETGIRLEMRAYRCGMICACCDIFGCPKVDGIEYYGEEEQKLVQEVENEKVRALQKPSGVAFVTFDSVENGQRVIKDHKRSCDCTRNVPVSSVSADLKPYNWIIHVAPQPDDIYWANLSVTRKNWYLKAAAINLLLFLFLFFLTTPPMIINLLDSISVTDQLPHMSALISEFLATLFLWTVAALMPVIVAYSDRFMNHWTRSAENHSVMRKTFIFLLFMLVILPSLGFTSAKAFFEWFVNQQHTNQTYRWECMFLPDNGAFFVNYVITSAFIGTALELIRFPELFLYMMRLGLARSEAETASIRRNILYEFQFGVQYAWFLLIFAMTTIYSVSCPLITPFGVLYMGLKHLVDKYNIYFAYGPSRIRKSIHTSAINFAIASVVILQLCLLFFSLLRLGLTEALTIYSIVLLCIASLVFLTHNVFHWFRDFSPIEYKQSGSDGKQEDDEEEVFPHQSNRHSNNLESSYQFIPEVLRPNEEANDIPMSRRSYGTDGNVSHNLRHDDTNGQYQRYAEEDVRVEINGGTNPGSSENGLVSPLM